MKSQFKEFAETEKFRVLVLAAVAIAAILPVLFFGVPFGYDLPHHYQCAMTFYESFLDGNFYPSWSQNRNFGFGGMESRLYPPVSHYALAIGYYIAGNWHIASWLVFTLFTFIGALGVYLWAKEYLAPRQAVFAGCVYALMPYHLNQLYNTFFYAEYVGSALIPFSFYFVSRICRRGHAIDVIGLGISFALLILTHLPLTVIGSICLAVYSLTLLKRENFFAQTLKLGAGVAIGLTASAFFWTKVLLERDLMAKTAIYEDPWLDYRFHFLITPLQKFEGELLTRIYETSSMFYDLMFLITVVLVVGCTVPFLIKLRRRHFKMPGVWIVFALSVFLAIPLSRPVWDVVKPLQEVQFPWRWLAIVSLSSAMLSAIYLEHLLEWFKSKWRPIALIVCGSILAFVTYSASQVVRQAPFIPTAEVPEYMRDVSQRIGFTFWWTIWTRKEGFENKERVTSGERTNEISKWTATEREFKLGDGNASSVRIATFYHPNWKATINEAAVEVGRDENGAITFKVPPGKTNVRLFFEEPAAVAIGQWLAGAVWLAIFGLGIVTVVRHRATKKNAAVKETTKVQTEARSIWTLVRQLRDRVESLNPYLIIAALSVVTLLPMMLIGVFNGGDLYQHIQFADSFRNAIADGDFYPSWGGLENTGYGSVGVRFYPPAIPFLLGMVRFLSGNWHFANCFVFLLLTLVGAFGVFLWAKEYLPSNKAVWASIIFLLLPYHLIEINNASMYAEFGGVSVITFSFLFVTRVCRNGKFADVLGLAIAYGLLILTHLPSTVIGSMSLSIFALFILPKAKVVSTLTKLSAAVFAGVCASAVYWSRMAFERDWMRNTKFWPDDHFNYKINFLLSTPWIDTRQLWFFNLVMLSMVLAAIGAIVAIYLKGRQDDRHKLRGAVITFFLASLMTTIVSYPIWSVVPLLPEVQFPWRWLTIASVQLAVLGAVGIDAIQRLARTSPNWNKAVKCFAATVFLIFVGSYGLIWIGFQLNYIPANEYHKWCDDRSKEMAAEWFWTVKTTKEAFDIKDKVVAGDRQTEIGVWKSEERAFTVDAGTPTDARLATIYYPHWKATVNNRPADTRFGEDGAILVKIPAEQSEVRLFFDEPARVKNAGWLSISTWLILAIALVVVAVPKIWAIRPFPCNRTSKRQNVRPTSNSA